MEKEKRFLSIRFKLLNPITLIFAVFILLLYFGANSMINGLIAGIFEDEIFSILKITIPLHQDDQDLYEVFDSYFDINELDPCISAADVASLRDVALAGGTVDDSDARYADILDCLNEIEYINPRAILTTFYIGNNGEIIAGVDSISDDVPAASFDFGEVIPEDDIFADVMLYGIDEMDFTPRHITEVVDGYDIVYFAGAAPIKSPDGKVVGGILVDVEAGETVNAMSFIYLMLIGVGVISFLVVAVIIYLLTNQVTASLRKLSTASENIEKGDYEEVKLGPSLLFNDEVVTLADRFNAMAREVYKREKELVEKVTRMKVFIDQDRRKEDLKDIVESDFFQKIREQKEKLNQSKMAEQEGKIEE